MNRTTFIELLEQKRFKTLKNTLEIMNAVDIALLLSNLEDKEESLCVSSDSQGQSCRCILQYE